MTWQPGQPVITEQDRQAWQQWRKAGKREQQRERRARNLRIDYYPDEKAAAVIYALAGRFVGGDLSSVINRIVADRKRRTRALPPE